MTIVRPRSCGSVSCTDDRTESRLRAEPVDTTPPPKSACTGLLKPQDDACGQRLTAASDFFSRKVSGNSAGPPRRCQPLLQASHSATTDTIGNYVPLHPLSSASTIRTQRIYTTNRNRP